MEAKSLENQIITLGEKHNIDVLKKLINKSSSQALVQALQNKLGLNDCIVFWNHLLQGFDPNDFESSEKRFACVKAFLDGLLKVELSHKQMYDLITRLCSDLNTFNNEQLVEILEHCMDGVRLGDAKCVGWKDLLPETLNVVSTLPQLNVNGVSMTGQQYRNSIVHNLTAMRWPNAVLTAIADMFKELNLTPAEVMIVLNKFSGCIQLLSPMELPALCFQLFSICSNASQIIIPILALEKYFHRFYYKKLYSDMNSNSTDFDSIDAFSDKELREAEETILHHLNYCTQYKITELQLSVVLRNFIAMPDIILTPFVISAILSMTAANREPDARLSTSILLPFLRSVIKNNEDERKLADYSVWCRDSLQRKQVDLEQVFTVLIDQNKDGKDTITPGLVNLAFILLKAKNSPNLNSLAIGFLTKFIRKRFIFGSGIIKKLAEWMIVEQEQYQYSECLTNLSVADTFTVSECIKTINYVLDFFLWIPGEQAMRMMAFILPLLKICAKARDALIETLRKAMNSSDVKTCRMGVYGFCMILKQLNNSNSQRFSLGIAGTCTQQSISGFSLMSQATLGSRNNPQRHFDMLTLEIIGLLRNCFNQPLEIKYTLYENLQRAVELNPKLVPHVLQFIDWHFRSYFQSTEDDDDDAIFAIKFDKIVTANDEAENEIIVHDNLGKLIMFVSHCLVVFQNFEADYDTREMKRLLNASVDKIINKDLNFEEVNGTFSYLKYEIVLQQLNFIEGLMAYTVLTSTQLNENVKQLLPLFKTHAKISEALKSFASSAKKSLKKPKNTESEATGASNITINGVAVKKINMSVDNIWDLGTIEKFLRLTHEDIVPFASPHNTTTLRSNREFVRYVLEVAASKVASLRDEPEYKQLSHSKRTLKYLTDITKVVYERCIKRLPSVWMDFDLTTAALAAECFQQCMQTANEVYRKKFTEVFVKGFDFHGILNCKEAPAVLHDVLDEFMREDCIAETQTERLSKDPQGKKIPVNLLMSLEVLYDNISYCNRMATESYTWLLKFCKENDFQCKEMGLAHKLLFTQRQKTHSGTFFTAIAQQLNKLLGAITDQEDNRQEEFLPTQGLTEFNSITLETTENCLNYLYVALKKQIEDVEYFIVKANNLSYKYRIIGEEDRDMCHSSLRALERSICSQLVHISNTLRVLTNNCIPLGNCMDGLMKLLMQHFICLKNLAKHFISCCGAMDVSLKGSKFDLLLRVVGKPLPRNIYRLITYIEANILDQSKKKSNPQADRAKVLRETKLIPKIILCVENFNKHVILLAKKTNDRLANFLHLGVVRDFRVQTSALKAAIDRTLSHSSQIEVDPQEEDSTTQHDAEESLLQQMEQEVEDAENCSESANVPPPAKKRKTRSKEVPLATTSSSKSSSADSAKPKKQQKRTHALIEEEEEVLTTPEDAVVNNQEQEDIQSYTQVCVNIAKINKKTKKRTLRNSEQPEADVAPAVLTDGMDAPPLKRLRGRTAKK